MGQTMKGILTSKTVSSSMTSEKPTHSPPPTPLPSVPLEQKEIKKEDIKTSPFQVRREMMDHTHKAPSFGQISYLQNIYGANKKVLHLLFQAKIDRGFFQINDIWTCYRRNYFQVSGQFHLLHQNQQQEGRDTVCYIKSNDSKFYKVDGFMIHVKGRLSDCKTDVPLVQHTAKRTEANTPAPHPISQSQQLTFERLQFKTATANNGKRRAVQQYFVIVLELLADLQGHLVTVATTDSAPIIVRGRSPGHYAESDYRFQRDLHISNYEPPIISSTSSSSSSSSLPSPPHLQLSPRENTAAASSSSSSLLAKIGPTYPYDMNQNHFYINNSSNPKRRHSNHYSPPSQQHTERPTTFALPYPSATRDMKQQEEKEDVGDDDHHPREKKKVKWTFHDDNSTSQGSIQHTHYSDNNMASSSQEHYQQNSSSSTTTTSNTTTSGEYRWSYRTKYDFQYGVESNKRHTINRSHKIKQEI